MHDLDSEQTDSKAASTSVVVDSDFDDSSADED
jgi:hypothetical protein